MTPVYDEVRRRSIYESVQLFVSILYYAKRQQSSTNIHNKKHKMHKHTQEKAQNTKYHSKVKNKKLTNQRLQCERTPSILSA